MFGITLVVVDRRKKRYTATNTGKFGEISNFNGCAKHKHSNCLTSRKLIKLLRLILLI
jgi:hypothetical protein